MNEVKEMNSAPKSNINALGAWMIAGFYGLLATVIWVGVILILEGNLDGWAIMFIYIFLVGFIIGHTVLVLPFFLIFWRLRTSRFWLFRYMVPLGFLIGFFATVLIKGRPIEELVSLKTGIGIGMYGSMLALAYLTPFRMANRVGGRF